MKLTQRFTLVVPLGTGNFNPSIARTVVTFCPGQIPSAQGAATVFSADDEWKVRGPRVSKGL